MKLLGMPWDLRAEYDPVSMQLECGLCRGAVVLARTEGSPIAAPQLDAFLKAHNHGDGPGRRFALGSPELAAASG